MKIHFLKQKRSNNRFNYTPRYYEGKSEGNIYEFGSKFSKYKETYNKNDFGSHWRDARMASRTRSNRGVNRTIVLIVFILVFLFLWLIEFDLSIFTQPR